MHMGPEFRADGDSASPPPEVQDKILKAAHRSSLLAVSARAVHRLLEQRHHGVAWPATEHPVTQLASAIIRRINEASGLYQMFGVLADVVLMKE